ncbi:DUF5675 family protein [Flavobacterium columnare]|uniref:DUF5675 domain-containing protein n=1 Tax=Flavobacterium columnare TaxID=996 RepID=A0AA94F1K2_9FLAO|nr:DUF5675 family protein [Flavobacterium columnare]MCH4829850.1 hypothetical protein [Flavobacterium columnare]MCH4832770.1 hypothetical protein [Flavobacterium columnare]
MRKKKRYYKTNTHNLKHRKKSKDFPAEHKPRSKKEEKGVFRSISETIDEIWDWAETQGTAQRDKPHTIEIPEGKSPAVIGKTKVEKKEEKKAVGKCPNCDKDITVAELKQIFTKADDNKLKQIVDTYNKYMKPLNMNTCWNKAHFFAQAAVESGLSFTLKKGESFDYLADDLYKGRLNPKTNKYKIIFSYFYKNSESYLYGRKEEFKNHKKIITQKANQEMIANLAYGPNSAMGKTLGNTGKEDGWNFRGKGCIQLTGRGNYEAANKYTLKYENVNILNNSDTVATDIKIAVLTSMAFFDYNKINKIANGTKNVKGKICPKVGKNVTLANGKTNYDEKQEIFDEKTSKIFKIDSCNFTEEEQSNNKPFIIRLVRKWQTNKSTIGEVSIDDTDIKGYILEEKGPDTTTSGKEQRIPVGTYNIVWHNGKKIKNVLKVYNNDVPIERAILIHKGNIAEDTEGCLLPGLTKEIDKVNRSKEMFNKIIAEAKKRGLTNSKLIITANYEN